MVLFPTDSFSRSNVARQTKGGCEKIFLGEHLVQEKHKIVLPLLVTRTEITSEGQDGNENLQLQGDFQEAGSQAVKPEFLTRREKYKHQKMKRYFFPKMTQENLLL